MQTNHANDDRLLNTIEQLRAKIGDLQKHNRSIGEHDTKAVLIEPLMEALDWAPRSLEDVVREYRRKSADNPVDYALLIDGEPRLFIEAKQWRTNLQDL